MKFTKSHEEALFVIFNVFVRQLGLPEKTKLITSLDEWTSLYPEETYRAEQLLGQSVLDDYNVFVNIDRAANFRDCLATITHELFHLRRPRVTDEYKINRMAEQWLNCPVFTYVDKSKL